LGGDRRGPRQVAEGLLVEAARGDGEPQEPQGRRPQVHGVVGTQDDRQPPQPLQRQRERLVPGAALAAAHRAPVGGEGGATLI